jgi:hypothetical protein
MRISPTSLDCSAQASVFIPLLPALVATFYRSVRYYRKAEPIFLDCRGCRRMKELYSHLAPWLLTICETGLILSAVSLSLPHRRTQRSPSFDRIERTFVRLARRPGLSLLFVAGLALGVRALLIPLLGIPFPNWNDEFSYLLAADTFAHGRLTNSTHPMWIHFQSFHIIQKPTYMSIYPPAEGIVLAAGQLLGHPWIGQLLVTALMCSALCWMLQGWLPPTWALLGATLAVLRLGLLSYWMNGYWSTSIVALGGALVLGAWPRVRKHLRTRDALIMSLGLVILANSRPYEGLIFAITVAGAMLPWLMGRNRPPLERSLSRVIVPIVLVLLAASVATGYYYYRVTGNPFRMTYQVDAETYAAAPFFLWQTPPAESVRNDKVIRDFYGWELAVFKESHTFNGYLRQYWHKLFSWWQFYLDPLLTLPLLALPWVIRQRKMRLPVLICAAVIAALAVETWNSPHYLAPATCALYLVLAQCMRHLWQWLPARRPLGRALVRAIPVLACAMILLRLTAVIAHVPIEPAWPRGNLERATIIHQLQQLPRLQLVIVRYDAKHDINSEWVYNDADIDHSKVVWARDMGSDGNRELLQYFSNRQSWLLEVDNHTPRPVPYPR